MANHIGQQLGNYRIVKLVGRGGFADVYLGEHVYLKTPVAIKMLSTVVNSQEDLQSFIGEAQTVARLIHPHIIRVTDFGVERDVPFLVMDYAPNGTLRQRHLRGTRVPLSTIVSYIKQLAAALQHAHDEKLIHRDVKPENMLLGRRDDVLLSDFGIALMSQTSRYQNTPEMLGTAPYMAPEQVQGKPRPASDQYALAIVVYEWLTGERPFQGSFIEIATQHVLAAPPKLREKIPVSAEVEEVIATALAKDPAQRFKSVTAFANALEQAALSSPSVAQPSPVVLRSEETVLPVQTPQEVASPQVQAVNATPALPVEVAPTELASPPSPGAPTEVATPEPARVPAATESAPASGKPPEKQVSQETERRIGGLERSQWWVAAVGLLLYTITTLVIDASYKAGSSWVTTGISIFGQTIDAGLVLAEISLIFPLFVAAVSGPLAGMVIALGGLYFGDLFAAYSTNADYYGGTWTWTIGRALLAGIAGLAIFSTRGRYTSLRSMAVVLATSMLAVLVGTAFTTYVDIPVKNISASDAASAFSYLFPPAVLALLLLAICLPVYSAILSRRTAHQN